jgi:peptide chain release factor subunit 3
MTKSFCFIGHVDSGKSTLSGHLIYKCGNISEHDLEKLIKTTEGKSYQQWSRLLDIYEEEQIRSKTHEFNIIELKYNNNVYNLIDTPGHKTFIRSMIEGVSYFDNSEIIGCLVISMNKGEFEAGWVNGQTKEDILIARAVGINSLIVLLNKMDTIDWNKEIYDDVISKITPYIKECNFNYITFIPTSGYEGIGLIDTVQIPSWYNGKSLIETIDSCNIKKMNVPPINMEKWNTMSCEIKIFELESIITKGYKCIMHYDSNEYEVLITNIKSKKFLKKGDSDMIILKSDKEIERNPQRNVRRIILRNGTFTIGFGRIMDVKLKKEN